MSATITWDKIEDILHGYRGLNQESLFISEMTIRDKEQLTVEDVSTLLTIVMIRNEMKLKHSKDCSVQ